MTDVLDSSDLAHQVLLDDPGFYWPYPQAVYEHLHAHQPVYWCERANVFAITKYADIHSISRQPNVFNASGGILLNDAKFGVSLADEFFPDGAELITTTDPPRHKELRRVIAPVFTPRHIAGMEERIRTATSALLDRVVEQGTVEWVEEVSVLVPLRAIADLLGLPHDRIADLRYWTDEMTKMGSPGTREELAMAAANVEPLGAYLGEQLAHKRRHPGEDLLSTLAVAEIDNERLSELNILMMAMAVLVAGNQTTRNLLSGLVWSLAHHPDQMRHLVEHPALAANAAEEGLRWVAPVPGFLRTASHDTEVRGVPIPAGKHLYMLYQAGNRDPEVFARPHEFDVTRVPDPMHVAFGWGEHVCIGAALARLEATIVLQELVKRVSHVELAGPDQRVNSVLEIGWTHLPVTIA